MKNDKWIIWPAALIGMLGVNGLIHNNVHADTAQTASHISIQNNTRSQQTIQLKHAESDIQYQANILHEQLLAERMHQIFNNPALQNNTQKKPVQSTESSAPSLANTNASSAAVASSAVSASTSASNIKSLQKTIHKAPQLQMSRLSSVGYVNNHIPDGTDIAQRYSHGKAGWHAYLDNNGTTLTLTGDFMNYQPRYVSNGHSVGSNWYPNEEYDGYSGLLGNSLPVSDVDRILGRVKIVRLGNAENLYSLQTMFSNMPKLWSVVKVGDFNTSFVSDMADTFHGDTSLSNISGLSDWYTGRVTDMQDMFQSDDNLSDLKPLADWDTSHVQEMGSMFAGSSDGTNTVLSDLSPLTRWDTSHVLSMGQMFAFDPNIADITPLKDWDTSSVYSMVNMFRSDSDIQEHPNWRPHHIMPIPEDSDTIDKTWRNPSDATNPAHRKVVSDVISYHNMPFTKRGLYGSTGQAVLPVTGRLYNFIYTGGQHNVNDRHKQKPSHNNVIPAPTNASHPQGQKTTVPQPAYDAQLGLYIDTVNYTYQGKTVGTAKIAGTRGQSFTAGTDPSNLPSQYKIAKPNQSYQYTGFSHNIPVELNEAAPVTMSLSNQNNVTIGYITLKQLGLVGQKVNIEPYLVKMMPKGYHLPKNQPIYITLSNGSSIIINA